MTAYPSFDQYFKFAPKPRGWVSLTTGKPYSPPIDGRVGGEPCRMETDAEYEARIGPDPVNQPGKVKA